MRVALIAVFEGSRELGPVPIFRTANPDLVRVVVHGALADAEKTCTALQIMDIDAYDETRSEIERLRACADLVGAPA